MDDPNFDCTHPLAPELIPTLTKCRDEAMSQIVKARELEAETFGNIAEHLGWVLDHLPDIIASVRADEREKCALIAEGFQQTQLWEKGSLHDNFRRQVASRIRRPQPDFSAESFEPLSAERTTKLHSLLRRIRPGCEVAPWVHAEIEAMLSTPSSNEATPKKEWSS